MTTYTANISHQPTQHGCWPLSGEGAESDPRLSLSRSLPENQYKYDDEDNNANRDIHSVLSLLMMAHPSPFTDYQALSVPCGIKRFRHAWRPAAAHNARCLVQFAVWQRWLRSGSAGQGRPSVCAGVEIAAVQPLQGAPVGGLRLGRLATLAPRRGCESGSPWP
jgi:hypothetical protein